MGHLLQGGVCRGCSVFWGCLVDRFRPLEPGLEHSGIYYLVPAMIERSNCSGKVHRAGMKGPP